MDNALAVYFFQFYIADFCVFCILFVVAIGMLSALFNKLEETQKYPSQLFTNEKLGNFLIFNEKLENFLIFTVFLAVFFVAPVITYSILSDFKIYPPINYILPNIRIDTSKSNIELTNAFKDLQRVSKQLENVGDLRMSEVNSLLTETVEASQNIENLVNEQEKEQKAITKFLKERLESETIRAQKKIQSLQNQIEAAKKNAEEAKKNAEDLGALTDEQKNLLIQELTKKADKAANTSFWLGLLASFPVGIIASLVASTVGNIFEPYFQQLKQYFQQFSNFDKKS